MTQSSWPDPANGRVVTERQYELLAARFSDNGLYWQPGDAAPVYADGTGGLVVKVRANIYGSLRGYGWESGTTGDTLAVAANATGATRQDRVVLRLTRSDWTVRMAVKTGGATLPGLTRDTGDSGVFEEHVGVVAVPNGAASLTAGTVTARPTAVGSRTRPQYSTDRNPAPVLGEIDYDSDTGLWVGWTGLTWARLVPAPPAESEDAIDLATKWPSASGINTARRYGPVISINLNVTRAVDTFQGTDPNGSPLGTVPSLYRPTGYGRWFNAHITPNNYGRVRVETDGGIWLDNTTGPVTVGRILRATLTYLR